MLVPCFVCAGDAEIEHPESHEGTYACWSCGMEGKMEIVHRWMEERGVAGSADELAHRHPVV